MELVALFNYVTSKPTLLGTVLSMLIHEAENYFKIRRKGRTEILYWIRHVRAFPISLHYVKSCCKSPDLPQHSILNKTSIRKFSKFIDTCWWVTVLTVVKLSRNMPNKELGFRFNIHHNGASRIFIAWINILFVQLKALNIWARHHVIEANLHQRGMKNSRTVTIDCTEIKMDQSKNPVTLQQTYSNYKSYNTVKVLVGMSPFVTWRIKVPKSKTF